MSTVKATHFEHPSASTAGITLAADGSVVLPQGFTGGIGSNAVQAVKTDTFTSTSGTFVTVTGLTATITPSSATSKVLVIAQLSVGGVNNQNNGFYKVTRAGTDIYQGAAAGSRTSAVFGGYIGSVMQSFMYSNSIVFLDSPGVATATEYRVEARRGSGGSVNVNLSVVDGNNIDTGRGASSITVIEVAA